MLSSVYLYSFLPNTYRPKNESVTKNEAFFPQMNPEKKKVELTEDEKAVMELLKSASPIDLNQLKEQTGLSNKKSDKAIKGLTKTQTGQSGKNGGRAVCGGGLEGKEMFSEGVLTDNIQYSISNAENKKSVVGN